MEEGGSSPASSFVGRRADLSALREALEDGQLVTIVGPPGIGKTRLAKHWLEGYEDGTAWFCDLSEGTRIEDICGAVSLALDIPPTSGMTNGVAHIGRALAGRGPVLLVLDNFEGVVDHAAATVAEWLRIAPDACFLVTSRARLRLAREIVFELGPLSLPEQDRDVDTSDAVQLALDRLRAARPDYTLTADERPRVAELVRLLDGNPLAIELAAARARALSTAELLDSLPRGLDAFGQNPSHDAPRRQLTLRDAVAWSWGRLTPPERSALAQCSVFRGSFDLRAARAVIDLSACPGARAALDVIEGLYDESLITARDVQEAEPRRFRLPIGVRELAAAALDATGERDAALDRHARHYLSEAGALSLAAHKRGGGEARRRLQLDMDNYLAIHRRALSDPSVSERATLAGAAAFALRPILSVTAPLHLLELFDAAIGMAGADGVAPPLRARLRMARAHVRLFFDERAACRSDGEAALAIAEPLGDPRLLGEILLILSRVNLFDGRFAEAEAQIDRALALDDPEVEVRARNCLGDLHRRQGRWAEARRAFLEGLRCNAAVGDLRAEGAMRCNVALIDGELGRIDEASEHLDHARRASRELGERIGMALTAEAAATLSLSRGDYAEARAELEAALPTFHETESARHEGLCTSYLAVVCEAEGRSSEAWALCEQALDQVRGIGRTAEGDVLALMGSLAAAGDRIDDARAHFEAAAPCASPWLVDVRRGHLDRALAREAARAGESDRAEAHARDAEERLARFRERAAGAPCPAITRAAAIGLATAIALEGDLGAAREALAILSANAGALRVPFTGNWFELPGGKRMRAPSKLWRVLRELALHRVGSPGAALSVEAILDRSWPGEKMLPEAGAKRVYTAMWHLRRLGLKDAIQRVEGGYLLDPALAVEVAASPERRAPGGEV